MLSRPVLERVLATAVAISHSTRPDSTVADGAGAWALPLPQPVVGAVTVPGSKSISNRALVMAALGTGVTVLRGLLHSDDTEVRA